MWLRRGGRLLPLPERGAALTHDGAEIRNALRLALAFAEQEAEQRSEAGGSMTDYITEAEEVVDTVRSALKVAENLP